MACLYYATFLVILSTMKGVSAGSVATGNTCALTSDCADTTNNVCVPTVLKCLIIPTKTCSTTDDKCVTGATCSTGTPTCSCDTTKHIAGTPADYCRLKLDQSCSASTAPCLDNGECASSTCKCKTGYDASADKTSCTVTVNTYGGACTVSSTDSCVAIDANAVCNTLTSKCECKQGFTGSIGAKCSGAMGLASSLFLFIAPLFIVTRLHRATEI